MARSTPQAAPPEAQENPGTTIVRTAGLCLVGAAFAVGLLATERLLGLSLPGCGAGRGCAEAAAGPWGSIPGLGWPVSYVGLAYFLSAAVGWFVARGRLGTPARWVVRSGAGVSVVYLGVMAVQRLFCPYCLAAHAGGLVFWVLAEVTNRRTGPQAGRAAHRALFVGLAGFVVSTAALAALDRGGRARAAAVAERDLAATTERLSSATPGPAGFTGRYRLGPERASVRVVVFTDYQCPDCRRIETELQAALAATPDASLSVKHFPFCTDCNPQAPNLHTNACWAARAAEAAGILDGADGFWRMHHWLFDRAGGFTDAELAAALPGLGFEPRIFVPVMTSPQSLERVRADIAEGFALGLAATPLIFINGVELRGWNAPDAVGRAIRAAADAAAARGAPATLDRPPSAREKHLADWREGPRVQVPEDAHPRTLGPPGAAVRVVVFGDYQEPFTVQADASLRRLAASRKDLRYEFRHFPVDQACNPVVPKTMHDAACLAARTAEVGAFVKGPEAFWTIHAWLMAHSATLSRATILDAAPALGFTPDVLAQALEIEELAGAILDDISAANALGVTSIPLIIVNDRVVPRWKLGQEDLLPAIVAEAAGG